MRFVFKTNYDQDIRLFRHGGQVFWYGLLALALLIAPTLLPEYYLSQLIHLHLQHRWRRTDAAHRLHRPGIARPRGVPCDRCVYRSGADGEWRAVRLVAGRRSRACRA